VAVLDEQEKLIGVLSFEIIRDVLGEQANHKETKEDA
jgi:Mg/Co/Ni transporter MgtE